MWSTFDTRLFLPQVVTTLGGALARAGDPDGARGRLDESLALAEETGVRFYDAETLRLRALLEGDPRASQRALLAALELAEAQDAVVFQMRIARDLYRLAGEPQRARLAEALERFAPGVSYPDLDAAGALLSA
jgi:hypothetical protein